MSIKRHHVRGCAAADCKCPWRLDYRPEGVSGPRRRAQFPTKKAAEQFLATTIHKVSRGEYVAPERIPTFKQAAAAWFQDKRDLHPASIEHYKVQLAHLRPLDERRLDQIDVKTIEDHRDTLIASRLSPFSVRKVMSTLAAVFKDAQRHNSALHNPAALAKRPRDPRQERNAGHDDAKKDDRRKVRPDEVYSLAEIAKLVEHATPGIWRTLITTVAATGIRPEEAMALKWGGCELGSDPKIVITESVSWARGVGEEGEVKPKFYKPKTDAGYREIQIAPKLASILKKWKIECPPSPDDLVFCHSSGRPLRRSAIAEEGMQPACRRAGLRRIALKNLRHSFASGLLAKGEPITTVAYLMGHSDPSMTLRVYSHFIKSTPSGAAARFADGFLGGSGAARLPRARRSGHKVDTKSPMVALSH